MDGSIVQDAIDTNIDRFAGFDKFEEEIEAGHYGVRGRFFPQYIDNIVKNLKDRFQEKGLIEKMQVLQPLHISLAHKEGELAKFGTESVAVLANHYAVQGLEAEKVPMEYKQYQVLHYR